MAPQVYVNAVTHTTCLPVALPETAPQVLCKRARMSWHDQESD